MLDDPQYILVLRLSSIGDILLTTPVLRLLRQTYPEARIECVVKTEFQELLYTNPCVDHVWRFNSQKPLRQFLQELRQTHYDIVLDLHRTLRSRVIYSSVKARLRLAYNKRWLRRVLLVHLRWNSLRANRPVPELYAAPLRRLGIMAPLPGLELHVNAESRAVAQTYLAAHFSVDLDRPLLALAPGSRWATKQWPLERFADVAQLWAGQHDGCVVLLGDGYDVPMACELEQRLTVPMLNAAGELSLMQTAALLQHCQLLLSNDSGLMHMATALGVPVVAIFGPTVEEFGFYPFQAESRVVSQPLACRPCTTIGSDQCPLGHHDCMQLVTTEQVLEAADTLWKKG